MSDRPLSLAFFDPTRRLSGTARAGLTLLFRGTSPVTVPEGPEVERAPDGRLTARLSDRFELTFSPLVAPARVGGSDIALCAVTGTADGGRTECLGTAAETIEAPEWAELDAVRAISAVFDREHAVFAVAKRPRGARGHGQERVEAGFVIGEELVGVEDARISTVYDGDGRQRTAGLELWLPGEDFPRRASGVAQAGASLALEGLQVNAAVFAWRMEGRQGFGSYELALRDEGPAAA